MLRHPTTTPGILEALVNGFGRDTSVNMIRACALLGVMLSACSAACRAGVGIRSSTTSGDVRAMSHAAIDSTIIRVADLTHDGVPDTVIVRLRAASQDSAFHWTVDIHAYGRVVLHHEASDPTWDSLWGDPNFVGETDPRRAKERYYFTLLPGWAVTRYQVRESNMALVQRGTPESVYRGIARELGDRLLPSERIEAIADGVAARLRAGTNIVIIPESPVKNRAPMIWAPELGEFVVFYRE